METSLRNKKDMQRCEHPNILLKKQNVIKKNKWLKLFLRRRERKQVFGDKHLRRHISNNFLSHPLRK